MCLWAMMNGIISRAQFLMLLPCGNLRTVNSSDRGNRFCFSQASPTMNGRKFSRTTPQNNTVMKARLRLRWTITEKCVNVSRLTLLTKKYTPCMITEGAIIRKPQRLFADRVNPVKKLVRVVISAVPLPPYSRKINIAASVFETQRENCRDINGNIPVINAVPYAPEFARS